MGYSFQLTARVFLCAPSHRQDSTYHSLYYTSCGALAGTRNSGALAARMCLWMDGRIDGWMDGWVMDGWVDGWYLVGVWVDGWMGDGWVGGWMCRWMDG